MAIGQEDGGSSNVTQDKVNDYENLAFWHLKYMDEEQICILAGPLEKESKFPIKASLNSEKKLIELRR